MAASVGVGARELDQGLLDEAFLDYLDIVFEPLPATPAAAVPVLGARGSTHRVLGDQRPGVSVRQL